jgi:hypothetical protein
LIRHCFLTCEIYESFVCMSIIYFHKMLYRCVMVEKSDIVKGDGELSIVLYDTDICDLPGLKRHI